MEPTEAAAEQNQNDVPVTWHTKLLSKRKRPRAIFAPYSFAKVLSPSPPKRPRTKGPVFNCQKCCLTFKKWKAYDEHVKWHALRVDHVRIPLNPLTKKQLKKWTKPSKLHNKKPYLAVSSNTDGKIILSRVPRTKKKSGITDSCLNVQGLSKKEKKSSANQKKATPKVFGESADLQPPQNEPITPKKGANSENLPELTGLHTQDLEQFCDELVSAFNNDDVTAADASKVSVANKDSSKNDSITPVKSNLATKDKVVTSEANAGSDQCLVAKQVEVDEPKTAVNENNLPTTNVKTATNSIVVKSVTVPSAYSAVENQIQDGTNAALQSGDNSSPQQITDQISGRKSLSPDKNKKSPLESSLRLSGGWISVQPSPTTIIISSNNKTNGLQADLNAENPSIADGLKSPTKPNSQSPSNSSNKISTSTSPNLTVINKENISCNSLDATPNSKTDVISAGGELKSKDSCDFQVEGENSKVPDDSAVAGENKTSDTSLKSNTECVDNITREPITNKEVATDDSPQLDGVGIAKQCSNTEVVEKNVSTFAVAPIAVNSESTQRPNDGLRMEQLKAVLQQVITSSTHRCDVCHRTFKTKQSLNSHLQTHAVQSSYSCTLCGRNFRLKSTLSRHLDVHRRILYCDTCKRFFHSTEELETHIENHHQIEKADDKTLPKTPNPPTMSANSASANSSTENPYSGQQQNLRPSIIQAPAKTPARNNVKMVEEDDDVILIASQPPGSVKRPGNGNSDTCGPLPVIQNVCSAGIILTGEAAKAQPVMRTPQNHLAPQQASLPPRPNLPYQQPQQPQPYQPSNRVTDMRQQSVNIQQQYYQRQQQMQPRFVMQQNLSQLHQQNPSQLRQQNPSQLQQQQQLMRQQNPTQMQQQNFSHQQNQPRFSQQAQQNRSGQPQKQYRQIQPLQNNLHQKRPLLMNLLSAPVSHPARTQTMPQHQNMVVTSIKNPSQNMPQTKPVPLLNNKELTIMPLNPADSVLNHRSSLTITPVVSTQAESNLLNVSSIQGSYNSNAVSITPVKSAKEVSIIPINHGPSANPSQSFTGGNPAQNRKVVTSTPQQMPSRVNAPPLPALIPIPSSRGSADQRQIPKDNTPYAAAKPQQTVHHSQHYGSQVHMGNNAKQMVNPNMGNMLNRLQHYPVSHIPVQRNTFNQAATNLNQPLNRNTFPVTSSGTFIPNVGATQSLMHHPSSNSVAVSSASLTQANSFTPAHTSSFQYGYQSYNGQDRSHLTQVQQPMHQMPQDRRFNPAFSHAVPYRSRLPVGPPNVVAPSTFRPSLPPQGMQNSAAQYGRIQPSTLASLNHYVQGHRSEANVHNPPTTSVVQHSYNSMNNPKPYPVASALPPPPPYQPPFRQLNIPLRHSPPLLQKSSSTSPSTTSELKSPRTEMANLQSTDQAGSLDEATANSYSQDIEALTCGICSSVFADTTELSCHLVTHAHDPNKDSPDVIFCSMDGDFDYLHANVKQEKNESIANDSASVSNDGQLAAGGEAAPADVSVDKESSVPADKESDQENVKIADGVYLGSESDPDITGSFEKSSLDDEKLVKVDEFVAVNDFSISEVNIETVINDEMSHEEHVTTVDESETTSKCSEENLSTENPVNADSVVEPNASEADSEKRKENDSSVAEPADISNEIDIACEELEVAEKLNTEESANMEQDEIVETADVELDLPLPYNDEKAVVFESSEGVTEAVIEESEQYPQKMEKELIDSPENYIETISENIVTKNQGPIFPHRTIASSQWMDAAWRAACDLVCPVCDQTFNDDSTFCRHLLGHQVPTRYHCGICNVEFETCEGAKHHARLHLRKRRKKRDFLPTYKKSRLYSPNFTVTCKLCKKNFGNFRLYKLHRSGCELLSADLDHMAVPVVDLKLMAEKAGALSDLGVSAFIPLSDLSKRTVGFDQSEASLELASKPYSYGIPLLDTSTLQDIKVQKLNQCGIVQSVKLNKMRRFVQVRESDGAALEAIPEESKEESDQTTTDVQAASVWLPLESSETVEVLNEGAPTAQ